LYVALAEREACQLVTADQKLANALGGHISVVTLLSAVP
jgi:predicted nucleic acid-binding protein